MSDLVEELLLLARLDQGRAPAREPVLLAELAADACDDLRFRVRAAIPEALAEIGAREGSALLDEVQPFAEGYFHASALLDALVSQAWLPKLDDPEPVVVLLSRAFDLADEAPRAAERWPGYKSLVESLEKSIAPLALRFGAPVLAAAAGFARTRDPHLREVIVRALGDRKLRTRFPDGLARALAALEGARKAPRDPRSLPRPTRKRGGGRRR